MVGRIPITEVMPLVDRGRMPAKATVGEPFPVTATVIREGHDMLTAEVVLIGPDRKRRAPVRMTTRAETPDRYTGWVTPDEPGSWSFEVQSWSDPLATWHHDAAIKIPAQVDVELMFTEGRLLFQRVQRSLPRKDTAARELLKAAVAATKDKRRPPEARMAALEDEELWSTLAAYPIREMVTTEGPFPVFADRERALYGAWYEFFPRSEGATVDADGTVHTGTLRTAAERLDAVAAMGFDVIYLPPIHPIGEVNRKGPNNTLDPARTTPAPRGRSAARTAATTPSTPTSATSTTSTRSSPAPASSVSRSPSTSRSRPLPTTPGSPATRSGSPPAPTAASPMRRTRRRSTRTSTPSTSTTTPRGSAPRCCASSGSGCPTACASSGSTTRTPSPCSSGSGCSARCGAPTPTWSSCPRRSPARR